MITHAFRLAIVLAAAPLTAGVNQWTVAGPPLDVRTMTVEPHNSSILYAAGTDTVARSDDRGATWTLHRVPGLISPSVIHAAVSIPLHLYVLGDGVFFRSTSGGTSWTQRTVPMAAQFQTDFRIDARNATLLTMSASNFCFLGCTGGGVFRSEDGGGSWRRIGLRDVDVRHVALDPGNSQIVYATTDSDVHKTSDGGRTWRTITPTASGSIQDVAVDPVVPTTIYAAAEAGVFRSSNAGATWTLVRPSPFGAAIATSAYGSRHLFASTGAPALSADQGETWRELSTAGSGIVFGSLWQLVFTPEVLYLVTDIQGSPGRIVSYEIVQPRRRSVRH